MNQTTLLIGASSSISERVIRRHLSQLSGSQEGSVSYVEGNLALRRVVKETWPDATAISAKSLAASRKAISKSSHLVLLWDGEDLSHLLLEARIQKKKTRLIAIQVTKVVNKTLTDKYDIYIGRGTPWGNPFAISHGDGPDREEVIEKYKDYFSKKIVEDEAFRNGIIGMKGLRLACFCKPQACHGDVIAEYLDSLPETPDQEES